MARSLKNHVFYKPTKSGNGGATSYQISIKDEKVNDGNKSYSVEKPYLFLTAARQTESDGEFAKFDWDNKITVKLELVDIGEMISVLRGQNSETTLYHKTRNGNKIIALKNNDNPKYPCGIRVSSQPSGGGENIVVQHSLSFGEINQLGIILNRAAEILLEW